MKKYLLFFIFFFAFCFAPRAKAYTIKFYNTTNGTNLCATCTYQTCTYSGSGYCASINRVSVVNDSYVLSNNLQYTLYTTLDVDVLKNNCTSSNFGLRSDFYTGNVSGNSWNNASTIVWNNIDDISVGYNGACRYTWGLVQDFTSKINSNGITFDFYFTNPQPINRISIKRFELQNKSSGGTDQQATINAINNQTNTIINNNNQNTQNIINSQNNTTNAINDFNDTLKETEIDDETIGDKVGEIQQISETPITDLLTMPITLLQKYYTGITGSCSPYNLGSLFNHNLIFPCINGQQLLGPTIWTIIDGLFVIFMVYNIGMMVVSFFESVTSLNDIFDSMYQPQHATYHPKHGGDI